MAVTSLQDLRGLAVRVLTASKTSPDNAALVAAALVRADADGIPSHGVVRLPIYADQSKCAKVDGFAEPELSETGTAAIRVDGKCGFAFPAIDLGLTRAVEMVEAAGVVAIAIGNSSHAGVLGHHVERLADHGLAAMAFVNTPAAISPWGGNRPLYGTDPIAFACPRPEASPLVIDLSMTKVARGKIKLAADKNEAIPDDWATDADGQPTTDAKVAMQGGSLLPIGDAKGAALALMVELMSAAPAKSAGIHPQKGSIRIGADADFTLVDLKKDWTVRAGDMESRAGWSPFEGRRFKGRAVVVVRRGKVAMRDREILARPGDGKIVAPRMRDSGTE